MESLIHVVGDELNEWEEQIHDPKRYSIITQHLMLAEKISKHQHLSSRLSTLENFGDNLSSGFFAKTSLPSTVEASHTTEPTPGTPSERFPALETEPSNTSRPSVQHLASRKPSRPSIPHRTSSTNFKRRSSNSARRPDPAILHHRSRHLFSSIDSTLSNATYTTTGSGRTSTSTPPSLTYSISTRATSVPDDDDDGDALTYTSSPLELRDTRTPTPGRQGQSVDSPQVGPRRSSSRLSPSITSTEQIYWNSETSRQAEYAKIDAAHSGWKGFVKKCLPRGWSWAHGKRRKFHQETASTAEDTNSRDVDDDSVRRYRVSIGSAMEEAGSPVETHFVFLAANPSFPLSSHPVTVEPETLEPTVFEPTVFEPVIEEPEAVESAVEEPVEVDTVPVLPQIDLKAGYGGSEIQKLVLSPKLSQRRAVPPRLRGRRSVAIYAKRGR